MLVNIQYDELETPGHNKFCFWQAAEESIQHLVALKSSLAVPSHGQPMAGSKLTRHFKQIAIPEHGRFVNNE